MSTKKRKKKRTSPKRRALSFLFPAVVPSVLLAAAVVAVLLAIPLLRFPDLDIRGIFVRESSHAHARSLLLEVRDIARFSTVEYVYRSVFPHDFLPTSLREREEDLRRIRRNGFYSPEAVLSGAERTFLQALDLCEEIGLPVDGYRFIVITARIRAGFDLQGTVLDKPEAADSRELARAISITEENGFRSVSLLLPEAAITEIIVEDADSSGYGYPDIELSPEQWKRLSAFVVENLRSRVLREGILETAQDRGERFVRSFLEKSGFDRVDFTGESR